MKNIDYQHYEGQKYEEIKRQCLSSGKLWEDDKFPASDQSLYRFKKPQYDIVWKRPSEFLPVDNPPQFIVNGINCNDIDQGSVGDCWFLSALANVADIPEYIDKVVPMDQSFEPGQYAGIFRFRFWQYGQWVEVCVDDRLPYMEEYNCLYGCRNKTDKQEMFPALVEKAYAKLNIAYELLIGGGQMNDGLIDLTGGVHETYYLPNKVNTGDESLNASLLWPIVFKSFQYTSPKTLCATSTLKEEEQEKVTAAGLVSYHAYTVREVIELKKGGSKYDSIRAPNENLNSSVKTVKLLKLRNPWGVEKNYTGKWSKGSAEWNQVSDEVKAQLGVDDLTDGHFFITFQDLCLLFGNIQFVNLNMNAFYADVNQLDNPRIGWKSESYFSEFKEGVSSYGCYDESEQFYTGSPQFLLVVKSNLVEPTVSCVISLLQVVSNEAKMKKQRNLANEATNIYIFRVKNPGHHLTSNHEIKENKLTRDELELVCKRVSYEYTRERVKRIELEPGVYVIIPSVYDANVNLKFLLRIFYEVPVGDQGVVSSTDAQPTTNHKHNMASLISTIQTVDIDMKPVMERQEISITGIARRSGVCILS